MPVLPPVSRFPTALFVLVVLLGASLSCGEGTSKLTIRDFIAGITDAGLTVTAVRHSGSPPGAGAGPTLTVTGGTTAINGGSVQVTLAGSAAFTTVYIAVEGISGYYQVNLPASVATIDLLLTLGQQIPQASFNLSYAAGATGTVGTYQVVPVSVIRVGTGEVQVSVSWNVDSDVDLHVVEPGSEEVFYGNPTSAAGGTLDLDSNAACSIDGKKNENITWAHGPSGTYTVRVDYWSSCGEAQSDYVVTIQRKGHDPETFTGSFTGTGDGGSTGAGTQITTFTFP